MRKPNIPESFNVLVHELRGLGIGDYYGLKVNEDRKSEVRKASYGLPDLPTFRLYKN
jgi:hypothetical protein